MIKIEALFPRKLGVLFQPAPYKILYGGRGGAKSWGAIRAALILGARRKLRILCAREVQNSIADSVHKLIADQIEMLSEQRAPGTTPLREFYRVQEQSIECVNGTEFLFKGLQGRRNNVRQVKSTEGIDIIIIEEADAISKYSWDVVIPTIRKEDSEIWIIFNPQLVSDETYQRFVINPPPNAIVVDINWRDNPWFSEKQNNDRLHMQKTDPLGYPNIWEGVPRVALQGAIFANELNAAYTAKRVTKVPYDPTLPVHTFWDLGWSDLTAIWLAQKSGFEYHLIGYIEESQKTVAWFLQELDKKRYTYGTHFLPHDGRNKLQVAGGSSIKKLIKTARPDHSVRTLPRLPVTDQINYARTVFPLCWFDEVETAPGLERLARFKFDVDEDTGERDRAPLHDINSHGASAFMGFAVSIKHVEKKDRPQEKEDRSGLSHPEFGPFVNADNLGLGWMR